MTHREHPEDIRWKTIKYFTMKYDPVSPKAVDKVIKLYFCVVIDEAVSDDARLCSCYDFAQTKFRTHYPTFETGDKSQKI